MKTVRKDSGGCHHRRHVSQYLWESAPFSYMTKMVI